MTLIERIRRFHAGRDPERLQLKWAKLSKDPLAFYRGTCHLFFEDLPRNGPWQHAPLAWLCGDLHLENFGSYRADNRLTYFDFNDFDEACRGPAPFDVLRLLTSIVIECDLRDFKHKDAAALGREFLARYARELELAKARWMERETANGVVRELLDGLRCRTRQKFLEGRVNFDGRRPRLKVDGTRALPLTGAAPKRIEKAVGAGFRLLDVARRVAGNGSLGIPRFVILAEDPAGELTLFDVKEARTPVPAKFQPQVRQPRWTNQAERIAAVQGMMLAVPPAFLRALEIDGKAYVVRELVPAEDRVVVAAAGRRQFEDFVCDLGALTAWGALRSSGRLGSATADELAAFGRDPSWRPGLLEYAFHYAAQVKKDWREFKKSHREAG